MIEELDRQLLRWAAELCPDTAVTLAAPDAQPKERGVSLYLYQWSPAPPARDGKPPPLQVYARYLVTAWADTPAATHMLLETLLFAALEDPAYEVDLSPLAPELWARWGLAPQPAFVLAVLLKRERTRPHAPRVRRPLEVDTAVMVTVEGVVVGPEDIPLAHAQVDAPALQTTLYTDAAGRFRLSNVPAGPRPVRLRVRARGQQVEVDVLPTRAEEPLIIRFASLA